MLHISRIAQGDNSCALQSTIVSQCFMKGISSEQDVEMYSSRVRPCLATSSFFMPVLGPGYLEVTEKPTIAGMLTPRELHLPFRKTRVNEHEIESIEPQ